MDANEYLIENHLVLHIGLASDRKVITNIMESYHQHRQAEEAQERYEKAIAYWRRPMTGLSGSDVDPAVQVPRTLRIAAGIEGKEEK